MALFLKMQSPWKPCPDPAPLLIQGVRMCACVCVGDTILATTQAHFRARQVPDTPHQIVYPLRKSLLP